MVTRAPKSLFFLTSEPWLTGQSGEGYSVVRKIHHIVKNLTVWKVSDYNKDVQHTNPCPLMSTTAVYAHGCVWSSMGHYGYLWPFILMWFLYVDTEEKSQKDLAVVASKLSKPLLT